MTRNQATQSEIFICAYTEKHGKYLENHVAYEQTKDSQRDEAIVYLMKYRYYEEIIKWLLPKSEIYNFSDELQEDKILDGMKKEYGIDYYTNPDAYDQLISLIEEMGQTKRSNAYFHLIMSITDLPYSLAAVLWPNKTKATLQRLFMTIFRKCERYEKYGEKIVPVTVCQENAVFEYNTLRNSWIYQVMSKWIDDGTARSKKLKKAIFEVNMK